MSFRKRLTIYCAGGIALVLILGSAATYLVMRSQLRQQVDDALRQRSGADWIFVTEPPGAGVKARDDGVRVIGPAGQTTTPQRFVLKAPLPSFGSLPTYVELIDARGRIAAPNVGGVRLPVPRRALEVARTGRGAFFTDVSVRHTHLRLRVEPAESGHAVLIAQSLADVDHAISRLAWSLGATGAVGTLLAALIGALVARGALRPVRRLSETAERVASTRNLSERIVVDGNDELSRLGRTLNTMLDSLEDAVASQRRLVADASHELRTPLTSLRTNIDVLRQGIHLEPDDREKLLRDLTAEIDDLTALFANLVDLARGSHRDLHLRDVRLDEVVEAVVARARVRFPKLRFEVAAEPTTVLGDSQQLERAVWNLVENAAAWSVDGAVIEVSVHDGEISVRDHGPGVAEHDRPFVFDRFYRADDARGKAGSGLGLAIVRQVAESHGGRVEVEDAEGGGARFRFALLSS